MPTIRAARLLGLALLASCSEPAGPDRDAGAESVAVPAAGIEAATRVTIDGARFRINGTLTHRGSLAEGALMNVRMVNSVFEDTGRPQFDPDANTGEFVNRMREYVSLGVRAFTVSLQGGYPGYEGARNSAFLKDGSLKSGYLARVGRVIKRADELQAVIILSLFYQRQDQMLRDEAAVRAGVANAVDWIRRQGYRNVILEIANEYGHQGFNHAILRSDAGMTGLIRLAKNRHPSLPVSASYLRNGRITAGVAGASNLILVHFNGLALSEIPARIQALRQEYPGKPIVCNEDARTGSAAAAAARASVKARGSYGLMVERRNQYYPFEFRGRSDDLAAYDAYVQLTQ
jgi:hypothetical protein